MSEMQEETKIYEQIATELSSKDESAFELTQAEKDELEKKYMSEKCDIQDSCKGDLQELKNVLAFFGLGETFSKEEFTTLQMLLKTSKNSRDGELTPDQIQLYITKVKEAGFSGSIKSFLEKYNEFKETFGKSKDKKSLQPTGGKDGVWGQDTFWYMLSKNPEVEDQNASQTSSETSDSEGMQSSPRPISKPNTSTREIPVETETSDSEGIQTSPRPISKPNTSTREIPAETETSDSEGMQSSPRPIPKPELSQNSVSDKIPGDQHPDDFMTPEEKIQSLLDQSKIFPKKIIQELQKKLGIQADGVFGNISAQACVEKFPEAQDLEEVFEKAGISTDIDGVLIGPHATAEQAQENFRKKYGVFVTELNSELGFPAGLIDTIIQVETSYGRDLDSNSGSKGLMQLTNAPFNDMHGDSGKRKGVNTDRVEKFHSIFQKINIEKILNIEIDGKKVEQRIPNEIVEAFRTLTDSSSSGEDFQKAILVLQNHLKGKNASYDHEANIMVGSVYLAFQMQRHHGNIYRAARDYNGEKGGGNIRYGKRVDKIMNSYS